MATIGTWPLSKGDVGHTKSKKMVGNYGESPQLQTSSISVEYFVFTSSYKF